MQRKRMAWLMPITVGLLSLFLVFQALILSGNGEGPTQRAGDMSPSGRVIRFLVMGRDASQKLTDSLILVSLDQETKQAHALQIPRDTYFEYTKKDYKKINGALAALGEHAFLDLLSRAMQVKIHYFVILDLDALDRLVDSVGGIDLESPHEMHYSDPAQNLEIHIPKGDVHLDGKEAEQFVRYRSGYVDADLGRLDAQKLFLAAFARKFQSLSSTEVLKVTAAAMTSVQTNLDLPAAWRLSLSLGEYRFEEMTLETLAGQAVTGDSGASYYAVNRQGAIRQINQLLLPDRPLDEEGFDANGLFDRADRTHFHQIYLAPEEELPLLWERERKDTQNHGRNNAAKSALSCGSDSRGAGTRHF